MNLEQTPELTRPRAPRPLLALALIALGLTTAVVSVSVDPAGAAPGDFTIDPGSLDFGPVDVGDTASLSVTVTNATTVPATPDLAGSGVTGPFSMASHCDTSVAPGDSCTIEIRFSPSTLGPATGTALVHVSGSSRSVALAGEGVEPITYSLTPPTLDFGDVTVGERSELTATITNTSPRSATPHVNGTILAPFSFGSGTCLDTLLPGESCTGTILFSPTEEGLRSATAFMTVDGDPIGTIALLGNGVVPDPAVVPTTEPPPTAPPAPDVAPATGDVTPAADEGSTVSTLPRTGDATTPTLVTAAALCLLVGGGLVTVRRRLRR